MYSFIQSQETNKSFDEVTGIDRLLVKLEYNALSDYGRIASDYGVPSNVLDYYENLDSKAKSDELKSNFDNYEKSIFNKVERVIKGTE